MSLHFPNRFYRGTAILGVAAVLAGCSSGGSKPERPTGNQPQAQLQNAVQATSSACPRDVARRADHGTAAQDIVVLEDVSPSVNRDDHWTAQFSALAQDAVARHASLRLAIFSRSAATTSVVFDCPNVGAAYNNKGAKDSKTAKMTEVLGKAFTQAASTQRTVGGTDIAGPLKTIAELPARSAKRVIVVLSDGEAKVPATAAGPYLRGLQVAMFGIGRTSGHVRDTNRSDELAASWKRYLGAAGVTLPRATSNTYTNGALPGGQL